MSHTELPNDPVILLSYINTQLRDHYSTLDDLCLSLQINKKELTEKLLSIDYSYQHNLNQFI